MPDKPIRKVFLAVPPTGRYIREDRCQTPIDHMTTVALRPPVDLLYAGAAFREGGAECKLVDYPAEERDLEAMIADLREYGPDLVLLSITTPGMPRDMEAAGRIKEALPETIVAAKGAHFNTLDIDAMERYGGLDMAFRGEFEPGVSRIGRRAALARDRGAYVSRSEARRGSGANRGSAVCGRSGLAPFPGARPLPQ